MQMTKRSSTSDQLKGVWEKRAGQKGVEFHYWFLRYKADVVKRHVLKPVREKAGFGDVYITTNRVECVNSMLSDETEHREHQLPEFIVKPRQMSERQRPNVQWAVINRGPYRLHDRLQYLELTEEIWLQMDAVESYLDMVLSSDVCLTKGSVCANRSAPVTKEATTGIVSSDITADNGLLLLADIALGGNHVTDQVQSEVEELYVQPPMLEFTSEELTFRVCDNTCDNS